MSYFAPPSLAGDADMKKIKSYVQMLNQQLQYCFSNIDPEDNFSLDALVKYNETEESIAQLEASMDGFLVNYKNLKTETESQLTVLNDQIKMKVSAEDMCSEISMYPGVIEFRSGYITIDTNNLKVYQDGSAEFSGNITGGSININDNFIVNENGQVELRSATYSGNITCSGVLGTSVLLVYDDCFVDGTVSCEKMTVNGTVSAEEFYETSDRRLKENIKTIPEEMAHALVLGLNPVTYEFPGTGISSMGFIAQEVNKLQKRLGTSLPMTDLQNGYYSVPYATYGALFAGAIKHQQKKLDELERMVYGSVYPGRSKYLEDDLK